MARLSGFGICLLPPGASSAVALQEFPSGLLAEAAAATAALSTMTVVELCRQLSVHSV